MSEFPSFESTSENPEFDFASIFSDEIESIQQIVNQNTKAEQERRASIALEKEKAKKQAELVDRLRRQIRSLKSTHLSQEESPTATKISLKLSNNKIEKISQNLSTLTDRKDELTNQIDSKNKEIESLEVQREDWIINGLKKTVKGEFNIEDPEINKKIVLFRQSPKAYKNKEISDLKTEIESIQTQITTIISDISELEIETSNLEQSKDSVAADKQEVFVNRVGSDIDKFENRLSQEETHLININGGSEAILRLEMADLLPNATRENYRTNHEQILGIPNTEIQKYISSNGVESLELYKSAIISHIRNIKITEVAENTDGSYIKSQFNPNTEIGELVSPENIYQNAAFITMQEMNIAPEDFESQVAKGYEFEEFFAKYRKNLANLMIDLYEFEPESGLFSEVNKNTTYYANQWDEAIKPIIENAQDEAKVEELEKAESDLLHWMGSYRETIETIENMLRLQKRYEHITDQQSIRPIIDNLEQNRIQSVSVRKSNSEYYFDFPNIEEQIDLVNNQLGMIRADVGEKYSYSLGNDLGTFRRDISRLEESISNKEGELRVKGAFSRGKGELEKTIKQMQEKRDYLNKTFERFSELKQQWGNLYEIKNQQARSLRDLSKTIYEVFNRVIIENPTMTDLSGFEALIVDELNNIKNFSPTPQEQQVYDNYIAAKANVDRLRGEGVRTN